MRERYQERERFKLILYLFEKWLQKSTLTVWRVADTEKYSDNKSNF